MHRRGSSFEKNICKSLTPCSTPSTPIPNANRTQNFVVHQDFDLTAKSRAELADLDLRKEAKLVVLNIAAFPDLLKTDKASEQSLGDLLYSVRHSMVHVKGTIALLIPPPWHLHSGRLYSECMCVCCAFDTY